MTGKDGPRRAGDDVPGARCVVLGERDQQVPALHTAHQRVRGCVQIRFVAEGATVCWKTSGGSNSSSAP